MTSSKPEDTEASPVRFGGRVTVVDFVLFPAVAALPTISMISGVPIWLGWACVGLGVLGDCALFAVASLDFADERSWIEGGRIQLPLILGSFVVGQMLMFASTYSLVSIGTPSSFNERLGPVAAVYFSVTTWTTAGVGDIHAVSSPARLLVSGELLLALFTVLVVLGAAVSKAFAGRH